MGFVCEVFVVCEDIHFMSKQDSAELLESLDCRQQFFFRDCAIHLRVCQLARMERDRAVVLRNDCTELQITGISVHIKWQVKVGVSQ